MGLKGNGATSTRITNFARRHESLRWSQRPDESVSFGRGMSSYSLAVVWVAGKRVGHNGYGLLYPHPHPHPHPYPPLSPSPMYRQLCSQPDFNTRGCTRSQMSCKPSFLPFPTFFFLFFDFLLSPGPASARNENFIKFLCARAVIGGKKSVVTARTMSLWVIALLTSK